MRVAVIGAGTMGAGIAQACLGAGHGVALYDVDPGAVERARERIAEGLGRLVAKGRLGAEARTEALARLSAADSVEAAATGAEVVIEAALEELEVKRSIFARLDRAAPAQALLASNTSALSISALAEATGRPEQVLGLHFFNPAPVMALVEVVAGERTTAATVAAARSFAEGLGKTPVSCSDAPGFIVNRVNRPFSLEPLRMLTAGEANVPAIDAAVVEAGYPLGPFAYLDLVGLDVNLAATTAIWRGFDEDERFRPSPLQEQLVAAGLLGRKTGRGFYVYDAAGRRGAPAAAFAAGAAGAGAAGPGAAHAGAADLAPAAIVERIGSAIINEAYLAVGEGVATPPEIDLAMRLGVNHPAGPFERAGQLGLRRVIEGLARLESAYGERYRVAPALWQVANA
ncbi:MAG TPA: 3-hydroxyacyl-CoA dehydrogenase NAD-binding domain-containing protein [Candidatus Limnocylindrales bacterium]|nr:3-hydroxyacyl-CoA dehydrogenase NAD-binding domain-containing protein [Candidatus Limnocylindrales bacterium]